MLIYCPPQAKFFDISRFCNEFSFKFWRFFDKIWKLSEFFSETTWKNFHFKWKKKHCSWYSPPIGKWLSECSNMDHEMTKSVLRKGSEIHEWSLKFIPIKNWDIILLIQVLGMLDETRSQNSICVLYRTDADVSVAKFRLSKKGNPPQSWGECNNNQTFIMLVSNLKVKKSWTKDLYFSTGEENCTRVMMESTVKI